MDAARSSAPSSSLPTTSTSTAAVPAQAVGMTTTTSTPGTGQGSTPTNASTNNAAEPVIPTEFTLFPKLPVGLRTKIWKESVIANERIVEVHFDHDENHFLSTTLAPAQLHTSSEARCIALKLYNPLSFGGHFTGTHIRWESEAIMLNMDQSNILATQLIKKDASGLLCTELYENCTRLVLDRGQGMRNFMDLGDITRADPHFVTSEDDEEGEWEDDKLFGLFEKLEEVSLVYLGKVKKGDGNLTVVMASSDPKNTTARPGTTRYRITKLSETFPKAGHFAQSIETLKKINVVKLDRGSEKRLKGAARLREWKKRDDETMKAFVSAKEAMDEMYLGELEDDFEEEWKARMVGWASGIPVGEESVPEEDIIAGY